MKSVKHSSTNLKDQVWLIPGSYIDKLNIVPGMDFSYEIHEDGSLTIRSKQI